MRLRLSLKCFKPCSITNSTRVITYSKWLIGRLSIHLISIPIDCKNKKKWIKRRMWPDAKCCTLQSVIYDDTQLPKSSVNYQQPTNKWCYCALSTSASGFLWLLIGYFDQIQKPLTINSLQFHNEWNNWRLFSVQIASVTICLEEPQVTAGSNSAKGANRLDTITEGESIVKQRMRQFNANISYERHALHSTGSR